MRQRHSWIRPSQAQPTKLPGLPLLLLAAVVGLSATGGFADVVAVKDRPPLVNTQVLRLVDGKLSCREGSAGEVAFPIDQVDYMQITGWQLFNLGEKHRRAGDWHAAASSYERALGELQAAEVAGKPAGPEQLDRALLVKCRLIPACDAQARFLRSLELYLDVVERMPAVLDTLRPAQMPDAAAVYQASARLDAAIARHAADDVGKSLSRWKSSWPRPTATAPASAPETPEINPQPGRRAEVAKLGSLISSGQIDEALSRISVLHAQVTGPDRAELYYWQGRALEALSAASQPASTQPDSGLSRAGIAYMRVVVHFPAHALAAECLYRAGELCRRQGHPKVAERLWSELVAEYPRAKGPDGTVWADKARQESKQ